MTTATMSRTATIRPATAADVEGVVQMAQHFVLQTSYGAHIPADADHLRAVVQQLLALGVVLVAVGDDGGLVGMLAGLAYPHYLTGRQTASETAWWVEPSVRGAAIARDLLRAFEAWAVTQGAVVVELGSRHERLDRFYGRLGYAPVERVFQKELAP